MVAASGNESKRRANPEHEIGVSLPAAAEHVISTGAVGRSATGLVVAPFSNTFPQVAAPGVGVLSARAGGGLATLNGTSMATPHTSGVAALWWQDVRSLPLPATATTVTARMLANADLTALDPGGGRRGPRRRPGPRPLTAAAAPRPPGAVPGGRGG